jgi:murein DD-endopeptidase MepM/ murein hydrolase activator NlpD
MRGGIRLAAGRRVAQPAWLAAVERLVIWARPGQGLVSLFCGFRSVKLKLVLSAVLVAFFLAALGAAAAGRQINAGNVLRGGPYYVLSEHGVPNGMPCDWYAYATTVGLPYCAHPGIDITANFENLYAATDGVIEFAGADAAYWPLHVDIRVTSEQFLGELHIYGHMSQVYVEPGQTVTKGELLGVSGEAGGGPHLHFERRTAPNALCPIGCAIDPEPPLYWEQTTSAEPEQAEEDKQPNQAAPEEQSETEEKRKKQNA